jgi:hypothetical protein
MLAARPRGTAPFTPFITPPPPFPRHPYQTECSQRGKYNNETGACACSPGYLGPHCEWQVATALNYLGPDLKVGGEVAADSSSACADACTNKAKCKMWVWMLNTKRCHLKQSIHWVTLPDQVLPRHAHDGRVPGGQGPPHPTPPHPTPPHPTPPHPTPTPPHPPPHPTPPHPTPPHPTPPHPTPPHPTPPHPTPPPPHPIPHPTPPHPTPPHPTPPHPTPPHPTPPHPTPPPTPSQYAEAGVPVGRLLCFPACFHGDCAKVDNSTNACSCEAGWDSRFANSTTEPKCTLPVCASPCLNSGKCVEPDTCDCAGTGYMNATCNVGGCRAGLGSEGLGRGWGSSPEGGPVCAGGATWQRAAGSGRAAPAGVGRLTAPAVPPSPAPRHQRVRRQPLQRQRRLHQPARRLQLHLQVGVLRQRLCLLE